MVYDCLVLFHTGTFFGGIILLQTRASKPSAKVRVSPLCAKSVPLILCLAQAKGVVSPRLRRRSHWHIPKWANPDFILGLASLSPSPEFVGLPP